MEKNQTTFIISLFVLSAVMFGGGTYLNEISVLPNPQFGTCEQYQGFAQWLFVIGCITFFSGFIILMNAIEARFSGKNDKDNEEE